MDSTEFARLLSQAEQLSPERYPDQAITLNQRMLQLDPLQGAAYVRLARAYQAQRNFAAAVAACEGALQVHPHSPVAARRLQRITEEWTLAEQAQAITTYEEALRLGAEQKEQRRIGWAMACLWRAVELSPSPRHPIRAYNALGAAYRSRPELASLDRAAALYERVLHLAPESRTARKGLAAVWRAQRKLRQMQEEQQKRAKARAEHRRQQGKERHRRPGEEAARRQPSRKTPTTLVEALAVLKLRPPASRAEIKRAYRIQARVVHPDHGGSHEAMVQLNAAYELALASF